MINTLLVAIDATPQHAQVLREAAELATQCHARLHVIAVNDPVSRNGLVMFEPVGDYLDDIAREAHEVLAEAPAVLAQYGLECVTHSAHGKAAEEIALLAQRLEVDLILIGHRHLSWLDRLFTHSIGGDLLSKAPCNVMVILHEGAGGEKPGA